MRGVLQGYDRRYDRLVDWVTETEGAFDDRPARRDPGRRAADRADLRHRRPLARRVTRLGAIDRDRHRRRRRSTIERFRRLAGAHAVDARRGCSPPDELDVRRAEGRPGAVAGGPVRRPRGGDEGARRSASARSGSTTCGSSVEPSGAPRLVVDGPGRASSPPTAGVARWHLSLTHTTRSPSPSSSPSEPIGGHRSRSTR